VPRRPAAADPHHILLADRHASRARRALKLRALLALSRPVSSPSKPPLSTREPTPSHRRGARRTAPARRPSPSSPSPSLRQTILLRLPRQGRTLRPPAKTLDRVRDHEEGKTPAKSTAPKPNVGSVRFGERQNTGAIGKRRRLDEQAEVTKRIALLCLNGKRNHGSSRTLEGRTGKSGDEKGRSM
jgi:hypothetical protein